jgi:hypothetical protein
MQAISRVMDYMRYVDNGARDLVGLDLNNFLYEIGYLEANPTQGELVVKEGIKIIEAVKDISDVIHGKIPLISYLSATAEGIKAFDYYSQGNEWGAGKVVFKFVAGQAATTGIMATAGLTCSTGIGCAAVVGGAGGISYLLSTGVDQRTGDLYNYLFPVPAEQWQKFNYVGRVQTQYNEVFRQAVVESPNEVIHFPKAAPGGGFQNATVSVDDFRVYVASTGIKAFEGMVDPTKARYIDVMLARRDQRKN